MKASDSNDDTNGRSALGRDPDEIERDIEQTRRELDRTLEALQARLSPKRRFEEAVHTARETGNRFVNTARENGSRWAGEVEHAARRHPVPFIVAGATLAVALVAGLMTHRRDHIGVGHSHKRTRHGARF